MKEKFGSPKTAGFFSRTYAVVVADQSYVWDFQFVHDIALP